MFHPLATQRRQRGIHRFTAVIALVVMAGVAAAGGWYMTQPADEKPAIAEQNAEITHSSALTPTTVPTSDESASDTGYSAVSDSLTSVADSEPGELSQQVVTSAPDGQDRMISEPVVVRDDSSRSARSNDDGDDAYTNPRKAGAQKADLEYDPVPVNAERHIAYHSQGYENSSQQAIHNSVNASTDGVLHITNDGDQIVVTRGADTPNSRAPRESQSASTPQQSESGFDSQYTESRTNQEEAWATANCPGILPQGSTESDAEAMTRNYGCRYLNYCRIQDKGDVHCWYGFAGING